MVTVALVLALSTAQQPTPQPFPQVASAAQRSRPRRPATTSPPAPTVPAPATNPSPDPSPTGQGEPDEATLGVPVYPGSQFIASYDAGRGQRFYLFGTSASYVNIVIYYQTLLRSRGDVVFEAPATHMFELGRFREEIMAFPPSVTVKDYQSQHSAGYPNPKRGVEPDRFPTVIQIVPVPESDRR